MLATLDVSARVASHLTCVPHRCPQACQGCTLDHLCCGALPVQQAERGRLRLIGRRFCCDRVQSGSRYPSERSPICTFARGAGPCVRAAAVYHRHRGPQHGRRCSHWHHSGSLGPASNRRDVDVHREFLLRRDGLAWCWADVVGCYCDVMGNRRSPTRETSLLAKCRFQACRQSKSECLPPSGTTWCSGLRLAGTGWRFTQRTSNRWLLPHAAGYAPQRTPPKRMPLMTSVSVRTVALGRYGHRF